MASYYTFFVFKFKMKEFLYLTIGIIILVLTFYDFFYTTLSGSGAGYLSKNCALYTHKLLLFVERKFSKKIFRISGMVVNLTILAVWVLLVWVGLFLVYSYQPEAITNSSGKVADAMDRLYYTGYVISTLGIGDYKPTSNSFEIITSLFSFFGFIFFSTSMTYLLSVSSAVVQKRSLASSIRNLGSNPVEIVERFQKMDTSFCYQQISNLQQLLNQYSTYYQAYPVLHFYHNEDPAVSAGVNVVNLDEAVSMMINNKKFESVQDELQVLRDSLNQFLKHIKSRFGQKAEKEPDINWYHSQLPEGLLKERFSDDSTLPERRKVLTSLLQNENRNWRNIYPSLRAE